MQQPPNIHWENLYQRRDDLQYMERNIKKEEIQQAVRQWPNNKSPGPDGFTREFYKEFLQILIPDIFAVFQTVTEGGITRTFGYFIHTAYS